VIAPELFEALQNVPDAVVRRKEPLARHVPLRIGGPADGWVATFTEKALVEVLRLARKHTVPTRIHWPFQDWIVREGGVANLVVRPGGELERVWLEGDVLWIGAAAPWASASTLLAARKQDAVAAWPGVPGSLLESDDRKVLSGLVAALRRIRGGRVETVPVGADEPVPEVVAPSVPLAIGLSVARPRKAPPSPAMLFGDPAHDTAARVLVKAGIVGTRFRGWRLSSTAPGTVVQLGPGTSEDLALLVKAVQHQVDRDRGVELETRIPIVGDRGSTRVEPAA
jgi:UDP-N-acetylenolpyruvoylglucosamine reductase